MTLLAVTGATGFVGGAVMARAAERGVALRALTRRPQPPRAGVEWIAGTLEDEAALGRLVAGADAVLHIAGAVNARDRAAFLAANGEGTRSLVAVAERAGVRRFVHVSSLAAREPGLSDYGWSKAEAERHVAASPLDWTILRPPAIYGPGDAELLELFVMARRGLVLLPPGGRLSIIHVADLAELLVMLAEGDEGARATYEVSDERAEGYAHAEFAQAIGRAVGRHRVATLAMPGALLRLGARIDQLLRGEKARLTPDRAAYFSHADWVANPALAVPPALWRPRIPADEGLAATAAAYRARGKLR